MCEASMPVSSVGFMQRTRLLAAASMASLAEELLVGR